MSDIHSYARPADARVTHLSLDLTADFEERVLSGSATLALERDTDADRVILDTRDLAIRGVTTEDGRLLEWDLGGVDPHLGQPLTIRLPEGVDRVVIRYRTSPDAAALQWLEPRQTAGDQPFLFSQGQAILTRTWIPTQDSPGVRQTFDARLVVPAGLTALMSAEMLTPEGEPSDSGSVFRFRMEQPVPPYLIALAVGDLEFRDIGPRTGVYAEPAVVASAASEFADLEEMVETAESLYGPYRWGRYDILVLPPSFPFGGMENPRLTFATPTILAGDRSLVSLVAHELAHSWSGNLVTNATWSDFWINEGFTTYFEYRIMEALYGVERTRMLQALGWRDLQEEIADLGGPASPETRLHIDLAGQDPDDGMTQVPYEKGAAFLRTIEAAVGREAWDVYLRGYFERYAFQPMTASRFLDDLREHLLAELPDVEEALELEEWVYGTGLPDNAVEPQSDAFVRVEAQAGAFAAGTPAGELETGGWTTQEWQHFLGSLPEQLDAERLGDLDSTFGLSASGNSEIRFAWLRVAVRNRYQPAVSSLEEFLVSQGRRKFLQPLYAALMDDGEWGAPIASRIYETARPGYHAVSTRTIDAIVQ